AWPSRPAGRAVPKFPPSRLAPRIWGFPNDPPEHPGEVRLVAQPGEQRNRAQWFAAFQHQALRQFDSPACDVVVGRSPESAAKCAAEVALAQLQQLRQIRKPNAVGEVRIDVGGQSPHLPGDQAAAYDFPCASIEVTEICRYRAGFSTQQRDRAFDVCLGGLTVTVARMTCRFHEPRGYH